MALPSYICHIMKPLIAISSLAMLVSALAACKNAAENRDAATKTIHIKPGTVVATDSMVINNDSMIKYTCKIEVIADSAVDSGVYNVISDFGPNNAVNSFTLPRGGANAKVVLKRGSGHYEYIIGFMLPGDTTFYDYYRVRSNKHTTQMDYIKAYSL